jgi:hypothetical protein
VTDLKDLRLLLDAAHADWEKWRTRYADVVERIADRDRVDRMELEAIKTELDRALADFMLMTEQLRDAMDRITARGS